MKGKRQTERGAAGKPGAYVIPVAQHDPLTADLMINKLLVQGIEIKQASKSFSVPSGMTYGAGTFVISMAQPKMGLIRYLLDRTFFPDNDWTRNKDGSPIAPYDMATDTMYEYMGVRVDPIDDAKTIDNENLKILTAALHPVGKVSKGAAGYYMSGKLDESYHAVNLLQTAGVSVRRVDKAQAGLSPGDFVVYSAPEATLMPVAQKTGVDFLPLKATVPEGIHEMKKLRIGMYQRYGGGNIDEGWTRFVLEKFEFPAVPIMDAAIKKGDLNANFDVIVFPQDSSATITGEAAGAGTAAAGGRGGRGAGRGGAAAPAAAPAEAAAGRGGAAAPAAAPAEAAAGVAVRGGGGRGGNVLA